MSFLERLKLSSQISGKEKSSPEVLTRQRYIGRKLQPYVFMGSLAAVAAPALTGCGESDVPESEKIGVVQQNVWSGNNNPTWGQNGGNTSPSIHFIDVMNGTAVFSSDQGLSQRDIFCSNTFDGGNTWTSEQAVSVSGGLSVNDPVYNEVGVAICADNINCPSPKIIFSSSRSGNSLDVYWGDFNLTNCQVSNVALVGGDINQSFVANEYMAVDNSTGKMYYTRTKVIYTADVGTWIRSQVPGITTTLHEGIAVHGSHLYVSAPDCPNGQGSLDLCRYDFNGTTASNVVNLNNIANSDAINDAQGQGTPFLDDAGDLWYSSGGKIVRKLAVGQGGGGGAGGSGGQGGSTGGSGGSTGGSGGSGGSTGGSGGSTGGSGGSGGSTGGSGGSTGGQGGSTGGSGGMAGSGGSTGGTGGGPGGSGGECCDGGGGAGAGGSGGSSGGSGGGPNEGGAGAGGAPNEDCLIEVSGEITVEACDYENQTATVRATGPGTIKLSDKTKTINEVVGDSCTYEVTVPNRFELVSGFCEDTLEEPTNTPVKYVDGHHGNFLGAEGSKKRLIIPAELNSRKSEGVVDVVGYQILDSSHFLYADNGCEPVGDDLSSCDPVPTNIEGTTKMNEIPEGTTLYKQLSTGEYSTNPDDFKNAPEVPPVTKDPEGCGCSTPGEAQDSTRADLMAFLLAAGIMVARRRRKGFVGVEVENKKF